MVVVHNPGVPVAVWVMLRAITDIVPERRKALPTFRRPSNFRPSFVASISTARSSVYRPASASACPKLSCSARYP